MGGSGNSGDLVALYAGATVYEAEIKCSALRAEGIDAFLLNANTTLFRPELTVAANPRGVEVMVRAADAAAARKVLGLDDEEQPSAPPPAETITRDRAGQYARLAARSAVFAWFFPPLALWIVYCVVQAYAARRRFPPRDAKEFGRNIYAAVVLGIVGAVAFGWAYYGILSN